MGCSDHYSIDLNRNSRKNDLTLSLQSSSFLMEFVTCCLVCSVLLLLSACGAGNPPAGPETTRVVETISPTPTIKQALSASPPLPKLAPITPSPLSASPLPTLAETPLPANVTRLPDPQGYSWQLIAEGFTRPLGVVSPMDGSGRLFILEQQGVIYILLQDELLSTPFLDLRDRVSTAGATTRGLLSMVFHPNYSQNGYFYVNYTDSRGEIVIAQYHVSEDANIGDPNSEKVLLKVKPPVGEHNGGELAFGPDGYLYISIGDGGAGGFGDKDGNAQNPDSLLGKMLRIDVDHGEPYQAPPDNPYYSGGGRSEIWASGLRNPWRFTFDQLTGDLYLADVGENQWEEVNHLPAGSPGGANFGWNYFEGKHPYTGEPPANQDFVEPLVTYDHTQGCSITGGKVYRGITLPEWYGVYIYADYCLGNIWGILRNPDGTWQNELLYRLQAYITSFGQDEAGDIYLTDLTGKVYKLVKEVSANPSSDSACVQLYYEENAQVEIVIPSGRHVLVDVYNPELLSSTPSDQDILLTTHTHWDHIHPDFQRTFPGKQLYTQAGTINLLDVTVQGIPSAHNVEDRISLDGSTNIIYLVETGGLRIAHFGDIGQKALTEEQLSILGEVDIAITQFANPYSDMSAENQKGFQLMDQVRPRLIIPTHINLDAAKLVQDRYQGYYTDKASVQICKSMLAEQTQVIFMGEWGQNFSGPLNLNQVDW